MDFSLSNIAAHVIALLIVSFVLMVLFMFLHVSAPIIPAFGLQDCFWISLIWKVLSAVQVRVN